LAEIERVHRVPEAESLAKDDTHHWRGRLAELISSGQAVHEWDEFMVALIPLEDRFRAVYRELHWQRDKAVAQAKQELETAGVPTRGLFVYECQGYSGQKVVSDAHDARLR
jgi:hypothetical protein